MVSNHKVIRGKDIEDFSAQEIKRVNYGIDSYISDNAERFEDVARLIDENEELCTRIGKAFIVWTMFSEIFGDVPLKKFRSLFLDEEEVSSVDE